MNFWTFMDRTLERFSDPGCLMFALIFVCVTGTLGYGCVVAYSGRSLIVRNVDGGAP